jgi:hypothetical protein
VQDWDRERNRIKLLYFVIAAVVILVVILLIVSLLRGPSLKKTRSAQEARARVFLGDTAEMPGVAALEPAWTAGVEC